MFDSNQLSELKQTLKEANNILCLLPSDPDTDSLCAALSLHLSLKQNGKNSLIGCSSPLKVTDSHLFGVDQVKDNIGNQNLVISFDYKEESIENVSYDIDEYSHKFNIRIKPQGNAKNLDVSSIKYSYTGASADLVFVFGINSLEELGKLYSDEKTFLDDAKIASINQSHNPSSFATYSLHSNQVTSLSEIIANLLKSSGVNPTSDASTNLYQQIMTSTKNLQSPRVSADTFDSLAFLLRSGAQKNFTKPNIGTTPQFFPSTIKREPELPLEEPKQPSPKGVPPDWQGPKIYRGSSSVR